jgi:hypothetical protein
LHAAHGVLRLDGRSGRRGGSGRGGRRLRDGNGRR